MPKTLWDKLSIRFNLHMLIGKIHPDAAVNIFLGWPTFLALITEQQSLNNKEKCNILDYGCGTGALCDKLVKNGHQVTGIDISKSMLEIAKNKTSPNIKYLESDLSKNTKKTKNTVRDLSGKYDAILSMHSTEWIKNIGILLNNLCKLLANDGLILMAVFPEKHIIESLEIKDLFEKFDSNKKPRKGFANFDGIKVPVFIREVDYYDKWFKKRNFEKVIEYYPIIAPAFKKKYSWKGANYSEMVILGYRKFHFNKYMKNLNHKN